MGLDHAAQILAGELSDAVSQALQNPKTQRLAGDTRAFSMRPLYAFEETYGKRRFAAAAAVAKPAAEAVAEPVTGTRSTVDTHRRCSPRAAGAAGAAGTAAQESTEAVACNNATTSARLRLALGPGPGLGLELGLGRRC